MESPGKNTYLLAGAAGISVLILLVFYPALGNDFVNWDDMTYVYDNSAIRSWSVKNLARIWLNFLPRENYHPMVFMTHLVEYSLGGLNPKVYHATNILLHIFNTVLLMYWLSLWNVSGRVVMITAALFAIHPLHVENVAWISDRKDLLMAFFALISLIYYHRFAAQNKSLGGVLFFFILALLSKTSAAVLPLVYMLMDYFVYKRNSGVPAVQRLRNFILEKIPFWILGLIFTLVVTWAQKGEGGVHSGGFTGTDWIWKPCMNASVVILFFIKKTILPLHLINIYSGIIHAPVLGIPAYIIAPVLFSGIILCLLFSGVFTWKIRFAFLLSLIFGLPYLQIVPLGHSLVWDRYFYMASIGAFWMIAEGFEFVWNRYPASAFRSGISLGLLSVIAIFSWLSWQQTFVWENGITLWENNLKRQPSFILGHQNLYRAYKTKGIQDERMFFILKRGLQYDPKNYLLTAGMGEYFLLQNKPDSAKPYLIQSILTHATNPIPYYLLAQANLALKDTASYKDKLRVAAFMGHPQAKTEWNIVQMSSDSVSDSQ